MFNMDNRNSMSAKKCDQGKRNKKKGKQGTLPQNKASHDNKENFKKTDQKDGSSSTLTNTSLDLNVANHKKNSHDVTQNMVNEATSSKHGKSKTSLENTVQHIDDNNANIYTHKTCHLDAENSARHQTKESRNDDSCRHVSDGKNVSKDEVDRSVEGSNQKKDKLTNILKNSSQGKDSEITNDISQQQLYKIKQDMLLTALEKSCTKHKDSTQKSHHDGEIGLKGSEEQNIKLGTSDEISEKSTAKTEKELRKLEWQKKLAEQNLKAGKESISKAEMKAKRREQQEAQRLAKQTIKVQDPKKTNKSTSSPPVVKEASSAKEIQRKKSIDQKICTHSKMESEDTRPRTSPKSTAKTVVKKYALSNVTSHLFSPASRYTSSDDRLVNFSGVHPEFIKLGVKISSKIVIGSNARCLGMLSAIRQLVYDLQATPKQDFCRCLESVLQKSIDHLNNCRPLSVCMKNALKYFKSQLTSLDVNTSEKEKKDQLVEIINTYIQEEIETAAEGIVMDANTKISNGDVILTFGCSSLVEKVLLKAKYTNKNVEVIVVDARPLLEGREMMRRLVAAGVRCKYVLINALSHVMNSVSLVFLGAHALLSNGYIMSRIGTAQVALVAKSFNKPVIVCSEAYKLSDLVQSDAFVYNELGDPGELIDANSPLSSYKMNNKVCVVNLLYDFTPPDFVIAIITELGSFHGKSITSIRRKKPKMLL